MPHQFSTDYIQDSIALFGMYKGMAEKAMAQCSDEELFRTIDAESNSIAIIVKHMAGNMRSRWTDFLTSDGEKPDRNRDGEFIQDDISDRAQLMKLWDDGWKLVFDALTPLKPTDLEKKVLIRTEPHSVMQAINRQVAHYCNHIGQIIMLAKHYKSSEWKTVTIPRNRSGDFNSRVAEGKASQR